LRLPLTLLLSIRYPLPEVPGAHQRGIAGSPALAGDLVVVATIQGGLMAFPVR
jgi:hypothetical protein